MSLTAERLDRIQPSLTIAISTVARRMIAEGKNVISLSQGEPDFDTPRNIKDAAIRAMENGETKYTDVSGTPGAAQGRGREIPARQRHRLQAGGDHHLHRCQAGAVQRHARHPERRRRGDHPEPVLGQLPRHRHPGRRQAGARALRPEQWLQAACRGSGSGDHPEDPLVHAQQPVQPDRRGLQRGGPQADLRRADAPSACLGADRRYLRQPGLRRLQAGDDRCGRASAEGSDADGARRVESPTR